MDRWSGKVAVVTGASSEIGEAIAEKLVEQGLQVVGFARRYQRIEAKSQKLKNQNGKLYAVKVDITKEEDILEGFQWVTENVGPVHILVNNAGILQYTNLTDGDTSKWNPVFDTNVLGVCIVTREAVKIIKANKIDGHIVKVNSICGHKVPNSFLDANVFPASKFALRAITETLRQELNALALKIKILSVSPGAVYTDIIKTSMNQILDSTFGDTMTLMPMLQANDVANAVLYVLGTPSHVQIQELIIKPMGELL